MHWLQQYGGSPHCSPDSCIWDSYELPLKVSGRSLGCRVGFALLSCTAAVKEGDIDI